MAEQTSPSIGRSILGAVGALAGLCLWLLVDVLADEMEDAPRLFLALVTGYGVFFSALLALAGPLRLPRSAMFAGVQALCVAALVVWASLRFDLVEAAIDTPHIWVASTVLTLIPLPFVIAKTREGRWNDYPGLFTHSWNIVVRYAAAWVFVGVVWGVVMLSDALFQLVGIEVIEDLLDIDVVPYVLTGAALGVALAVVHELSDYVSPYLVLRLLRLLLPVVLVVVAVFIVALPFRGLSHLFGSFSAAATLMAMAMGATTLITTALDIDDTRAVDSRPMRAMTQLMALTLPALGGLAAAAIWLRVDQYGWTPDRLAAATVAFLVLCYGVAYAVSVVMRGDWAGHIRQLNIVLSLVSVTIAVLWLTPIFNAQRLSTNSQIARFEAGKVSAEDLDIWLIGREWGRAGQAGLERLAAMSEHPQADLLAERIALMKDANNRWVFESGDRTVTSVDKRAQVLAELMILPQGAQLPDNWLASLRTFDVDQLLSACARQTPAGHRGCAVLMADLTDLHPGDEVLLLKVTSQNGLDMTAYYPSGDGYDDRHERYLSGGRITSAGGAALDRVVEGALSFAPAPARVLELNGSQVYFGP